MSEEQQQYSPSDGSSTEGNGLLLNRCTESELLSLIDVSESSGSGREATLEVWIYWNFILFYNLKRILFV